MATIDDVKTAYKAIYRADPSAAAATAVAASIDAGTTSLDGYISSLISSNLSTTGAAIAMAAVIEGKVPTSARVDSLVAFSVAQEASYSKMGANSTIGAYEALGKAFAADTTSKAAFSAKYGGGTDADFVEANYFSIFGTLPSPLAESNLLSQVAYFTKLYTSVGVAAADATLQARGAVLGQMIGYAVTDPTASKSAVIDDQVKAALTSAAKGDTKVYDAILPPAGGANAGTTYTLTTGLDNIPGTPANDSVLGTNNGGATSTLTAADIINGSSGSDSLFATLDVGSGGTLPGASYTSIENFYLRNVSGVNPVLTQDFGVIAGEEQVWNDRSTNSVTVTNLAAGTTVGLKGASSAVAATDATYVATATAAKIALDGGITASAGGTLAIKGAGLTAATLTSTGGANNVASLSLANTITSLSIDATTAFSIADGVAATADALTGTGLTTITIKGAGAVSLGAAATPVAIDSGAIPAGVNTITATENSGGVTVILNSGQNNMKFSGGSGNDVVTTDGDGTKNLLSTAKIDAGAGTADRLIVAATNDILIAGTPTSKTQGNLYFGFEQLQVQNGVSTDVELLNTNNAIDTIRINDGNLATGVSNLSAVQAAAVRILSGADSTNGAITIDLKGAGTSGQIDTVKAVVETTNSAGTAATAADLRNITLTSIENLELTGSNGSNANLVGRIQLDTTNATALQSIKLNNANIVNNNTADDNAITVAAGQTAINLTIDATGSGDTQIDASAYNPIGSATAGVKIVTGAGNDIVTGSLRADDITLGAGSDTVKLSTNGNVTPNLTSHVIDTVNDFTFGTGGDVIDLGNLGVLRPFLNGTVNATLVSALNSAIPVGTNAAELIILDSTVAALQAGNASALNNILFNLAGNPNQGQVLVAFASSATADVRLAVATIGGGDINTITDLAILKGVTTSSLNSSFAAANLTGFQSNGVTFTANKNGFSTLLTTDSNEAVAAGTGNDTINATVAQLANAIVNGGLGTDTLNITGGGTINLAATVNGGTTVSIENITLAAATTLTSDAAAHAITGSAAADTVSLGSNAATTYNTGGGADTVNLGANGQSVTDVGGSTVNIGAFTSGTIASGGAGTSIGLVNGANLSGFTLTPNGGGFTLDFGNVAGAYTMTGAQASLAIANFANAQSITLSDTATVTAQNGIETYFLNGAGQTINMGANTAGGVTGGAGNDTITFLGNTYTGTYNGGGGNNVVSVTATNANLSGATFAGITSTNIVAGASTTLNSTEHNSSLGAINANGGTIILSDVAANTTANATVGTYSLANNANLTVAAGNTAVNINDASGGAAVVTINGLTVTGTYALGSNGGDAITASTGANIAGVNAGGVTTAKTLNLTGGITMTAAQHNDFTTVNAAGGADSVSLTTAGTVTANAAIETYSLGNGTNNFTFSATGQTVNANAGADTINASIATTQTYTVNLTADAVTDRVVINNTTYNIANTNLVTINGFVVANDAIQLQDNGTISSNAGFVAVAAGSNTNTVVPNRSVIEIEGSNVADFTATADGGAVETTIAAAIGNLANGNFTVALYSGADAGIYHLVSTAAGNDATTGNITIEYVGLLKNVGLNNLTNANFF